MSRGNSSCLTMRFRLGSGYLSTSDAGLSQSFGTNPSFVNLMQRSFTRADEKALLASISYDFEGLGISGLSAILNVAAGFDAKTALGRDRSQTADLTFDYRIDEGWFESFWLRVRASWLYSHAFDRHGSDVRVILKYDFPVI